MYLKSIEISGFKSFAKKTELGFLSSITSIVGPNGSGKSNVVEAFRFVLGEQSLKSMRGKRGEDLIWNGGQGTVGRSNRASVKIVFDNSIKKIGNETRRLLNIDFDEVSLERVVYRDSISEYLINGSQVKLKNIAELLSSAHIGASGHHIISQGEADHILIANSKERKEMIEDALGLKIYQYKKREGERKLEKTRENITQVESLRKEIVPHLKFLKKQVEKIEKTAEIKEKLKKLYHEYIRREFIYIEAKSKEIIEERKKPEELLIKLEKELENAKKILSETPGIDKKRTELLSVESKLNRIRGLKDEKAREIGRLEGELGSTLRICEKMEKETLQNENSPVPLSKVTNLGFVLEKEISAVENSNEIGDFRSLLKRLKEIIKNFVDSNKNVKENDIETYREEIKKINEGKKKIETELKKLNDEEELLYKEYGIIKDSIESEKDKSHDAEKRMFELMAEQKEAYASLSIVKDHESKVVFLKEVLEREIGEGAILVGREILDYEKTDFKNEKGESVSKEIILTEERKEQEERLRQIQKDKVRIEDAGLGGGEDVLKEYNEVNERETFLTKELADLEQSSNSLEVLIKDLEDKLSSEFKNGVSKINAQFESFFALMFGGGKASIRVVEELKQKKNTNDENIDEIEDFALIEEKENLKPEIGIDIDVKLPRKNIKGLEMLSGGERALTSIALLFAISQVNPPPFIILDETDAALDEANSRKYGDMIESLSKLSQLILITHNRETMSRAGTLYGVTMGNDGVSKLLSVQFEQALAVAK